MAKGPFIWETHEYYFQEKTSDWFWAVGIIAVSIAVISIIFGNIVFALLILTGSFSMAIFAARVPQMVRFEINKTGVIIDKTLYPYGTLDSFWVEDNTHIGHHSRLFIKSRKLVVPMIAIPLDGMPPEEIRDFLLDHILEDHHVEPFGDRLLSYLGF